MTDLHVTAPGAEAPPDSAGASGLDLLRHLVQTKVHRDPITIGVPERQGWRLRFDANIPSDRRRALMDQATDTATMRLDGLRFAAATLAEKHEAIIDPSGDEVTEDGVLLTFRSEALHRMLGVTRSIDAVTAFFGVDPHVDDAAQKLYEAAGYFDEVPVDPTTGSSPK